MEQLRNLQASQHSTGWRQSPASRQAGYSEAWSYIEESQRTGILLDGVLFAWGLVSSMYERDEDDVKMNKSTLAA